MTSLAAYLHTLDPFAIQFGSGWGIRWYGLSYLLGFFIGYLMIKRVVRVGISTLTPDRVADLVVTLAIGIVVGGRLGYVLFYDLRLLWTFSGEFPWWNALAINKGGMASHGGMLGGIVASWWYARRHGHRWTHLLDLFAFAAPPGLFFGRIANFINGELFGREAPRGLPWAVKFPQEMHEWGTVQLQQAAMLLDSAAPGRFPFDSPDRFIDRVIRAIQDGDATVRAVIEPLLTALHPSQLYAAIGEGLIVGLVLALAWMRPRKPMLIGSLFSFTYAAMRITDEMFRQPDEHIANKEFALTGITRGQWLSFGLVAVGLFTLTVWARSKAPRMGGWLRSNATSVTDSSTVR